MRPNPPRHRPSIPQACPQTHVKKLTKKIPTPFMAKQTAQRFLLFETNVLSVDELFLETDVLSVEFSVL